MKGLCRLAILIAVGAPGAPGQGFLEARPSERSVEDRTIEPGARRVDGSSEMPPRISAYGDEVVSLAETDLSVSIRHGIAACRLVQTFQNNTDRVLEGTYRLPLPEGAEVNGFAVWDEGEKLVGEILPREQASRVYDEERTRLQEKVQEEERREAIRNRHRDPGELTRDSSRACSIRVFPILRRGMKRVEVDYSLVLEPAAGRSEYSFPLSLARTFQNVGRTRVEVDLGDGLGIAGLEAPRGASIEGENPVCVSFESHGVPERDFTVAWRQAEPGVGVHLVAHRPEGEDGFFLLRVSPRVEALESANAPADWLVLADLTGSVVRDKERLLDRVVGSVLRAVPVADRFRLVAFGGRTRLLSGGWAAAEARNVDLALEELESILPEGSPEFGPILASALADLPRGRASRTILVSDGIFGEDEPEDLARILREGLPVGARFDAVGLGYDDDEELLSALTAAGGGEFRPVRSGEVSGMGTADLGLRVAGSANRFRAYGALAIPGGDLLDRRFLRAGRAPLSSLAFSVASGPIEVFDVHADWDAGLFPGEAAFVFGRYRGAGAATVRLTGRAGSGAWSRDLFVDFPAAVPENRMVAAFWARREVDAIERSGAGAPSEADRRRIVDLSTRYRIVTSQTAFLALTDEMRERHALGEAPADDVAEFYTFSEGVPEPETIALVLVAIAVLAAAARRRARAEAFA